MNPPPMLTRPHRLLLARFFSQGLLAAAAVTLAVGAVLTQLDRGNHVEHAAASARERVARVAERLAHEMDNLTPEMRDTMPSRGTSPVQQLVAQEGGYGGMLRLEVVDAAGLVVGAGDGAALGQPSEFGEVAEAARSGQTVSRVLGPDSAPFLRVAAPIAVRGDAYVVLVDEPLAEMEAMLRDSRGAVTLTLSLGFIFTFSALGLVVRRAGLDLEHHQQEEARVKDLLGRYVSHQVARQILARGGLKVGGERRQITIVFADIRGFTSLSESLPPERVVALLNDYLAAMTDVVFRYDGTVDKFLGDGLMAIFGAPLGHDDDVERALACAREMQSAFDALRAKWRGQGLPDLGLGIGVNTGEAVVGSIGSAKRLDYTAIGDAVNTAQRLQSIAQGGQILLSAATRERAGGMRAQALGPQRVKGKRHAVDVFALG